MIKPGQVWNDQNGRPIQSHLGGILHDHGVYYWYGMNHDGATIPAGTFPRQDYTWLFNRGITVYSSRNLLDWHFENMVLSEISFAPGDLLQPLNTLVRPKVIRNGTTGPYVLMAALTAPDFDAFCDIVVATSDSPTGPFTLRGKLGWKDTPNQSGLWNRTWPAAANDPSTRIRGFDPTLFQDTDGKAYLIVCRIDGFIYELSEDYLSVKQVRRMEGVEGEAPALFQADGSYYLLTSRLSGFLPNQNTYFTSSSIWGPWTPRGPFAQGPREETTFDSQVTFVLPVADRTKAFIFMADNFNAVSGCEVPDMNRATHTWLPINLDPRDQSLRVVWRDQWDPSAFIRPQPSPASH